MSDTRALEIGEPSKRAISSHRVGGIAGFRPDVEGLRGVAILVVVAFHCGVPGFGGGFIGVDVFFVLSGYLITGLLIAELEKTSRLSLLNFYARRVRRLLPASALVTVVTLVICAVLLAPNELAFAGRAARASALYMSNMFFASNASDYFAPNVETNPMLHTWTLAVEEQFYLLWPLLIMLGLQICRSRKALAALLSAVVLLSFSASVWFTARGGVFAFYGLPTRAWEFGIGGLAVILPTGILKSAKTWAGIGILGILSILWSAHSILNPVDFPGWIALIPVLGTTAALIAGAEQPGRGLNRALGLRPLQILGSLSYSWYLWHWPFLVFAQTLVQSRSVWCRLVAAGLSLVVAAAAHRFVENPIRFNTNLVKRPKRSLYLGVVLTLSTLSIAFLSVRFAAHLANTPAMKAIDSAVGDIADMSRDQCLSLEASSDVKTCVFGDASSTDNLVLFGDSHARQWFNPLRRIVLERGWKLTTLVRADCPATDIRPPDLTAEFVTKCAAWREEAIRRIITMHPSAVFVGNATYYLGHGGEETASSVSFADWKEGTRRTLGTLSSAGLTVISVRDNPLPPFDVPTCLQRSARHSWYVNPSCEFKESVALNPAIFESEKMGANGLAHVHFLDFTDQFCHKEICPAVHDGMIVYRDDNHLTGNYTDSLKPALQAKLEPILDGIQ